MVSFRDAAADAVSSTICAIIAVNDDASRLFGRVVPSLASAADYANFFAPLRTQFCDEDPNDYVPPAPPFSGGQCPGVAYNATWERRWPVGSSFEWQARSRIAPGLIGPVQLVNLPDPGGCAEGTFFTSVRITSFDGSTPTQISTAGCADVPVGWRNLVLTRRDGLPDDCGGPPIPQPEPGPVERPITINFDTDVGVNVDLSGDIIFGPAFSTGDFNLRVPFSLNLGDFNWNGNIQLTPTLDLTIAPSFNFGGGGGADPTPITPRDPADPTPPDPEPNEPVIIGVIVRAVLSGQQRASEIDTDNIPTIFAPRLGSVSFAINAGVVSAWTADIDIKNRDQYIPCPAPQGAAAVAATAAPGVTLSWTPVRGTPLLDLTP